MGGLRGKRGYKKSKLNADASKLTSDADASSDDGSSCSSRSCGLSPRDTAAQTLLATKVSVHAVKALSQFSRPPDSSGGTSPTPPLSLLDGSPISLKSLSSDRPVIDVDELRQDFIILRHETQKIRERTEEVEQRVAMVEDTLHPLLDRVDYLQRQLMGVLGRLDDMENRLRCNNICLVGLPEKVEGNDSVLFLETWLKDLLPVDTFSPYFSVERAHRVPAWPPPPGGPPCPFLDKLLHFKDRDAILRAVQLKGKVICEESRVSFYPDFSVELHKQRGKFTEVRSKLRAKGYRYSMLYPASGRWNFIGWMQHLLSVLRTELPWTALLSAPSSLFWGLVSERELGYQGPHRFRLSLRCTWDLSLPALSRAQAEVLDTQFTLEELVQAIKDLPHGKTPGLDWKNMKHILGLLFAVCLKTGFTESCDDIVDCSESPDWNHAIFCQSVFNEKGRFLHVKCSWLPYESSVLSKKTGYKLHQVWPEHLDCLVTDTYDTSMILEKDKLETDWVTTIWVSYEISDQLCVKTNNFSILPKVNCQFPNIQHAIHSGNFLRFHLDKTGQVRYREITSSQWHTINVTNMSANISLPGTLLPESYVMQQRCFNEFCFHCKWETETIVPHELLGAPDIMVTTEKLSPGKQRLILEWKYIGHDFVDGYRVMIQRLPNSCGYIMTFNTTNIKIHVNLSVAFFNVSVMAYNKAGTSRSASTVVPLLAEPDFPGKINATYVNNTIFLSWSPLFECDFVVINWGTGYSKMESKTIMDKIENYSIPGPFVAMERYTIMISLYNSCRCKDSTEETTFGLTYIYTEEGVPRTGPHNVTVKNITKTSAVIEWEEIPEDDCLGFLLGYRISCIDTSGNSRIDIYLNTSSQRIYQIEGLAGRRKYEVTVSGVTATGVGAPSVPQVIQTLTYGEAELQTIIIVTCAGLILSAIILVRVCAYTVHRVKKRYFPKIPNPKHSHIVKMNEATGTKTLLMQSSPYDEEKSCSNHLGVEVTQQIELISDKSSIQEMDNSVGQKTSNHQKTSHAYAANVEDYIDKMSVLKAFQRMPETTSYVRQQPTDE
ncbi:uncharacterized protein LOC130274270 [Hyla sarda]|uniref:uncharacterized protein LOC130274270 n=1 Tax=Hyla sarda TaxID=327740 RepID=UPI0024C27051|nr:uncharacterized protein LOC130274270 [Hyla sarda]